MCGYLNDSIEHFSRESISCTLLGRELPMSDWRDICPYLFETNAKGIHRWAMTTVILDFSTAVAALFDRGSHATKSLWFAFGQIEQTVMGRIQSARDGEAALHLNRDRV